MRLRLITSLFHIVKLSIEISLFQKWSFRKIHVGCIYLLVKWLKLIRLDIKLRHAYLHVITTLMMSLKAPTQQCECTPRQTASVPCTYFSKQISRDLLSKRNFLLFFFNCKLRFQPQELEVSFLSHF